MTTFISPMRSCRATDRRRYIFAFSSVLVIAVAIVGLLSAPKAFGQTSGLDRDCFAYLQVATYARDVQSLSSTIEKFERSGCLAAARKRFPTGLISSADPATVEALAILLYEQSIRRMQIQDAKSPTVPSDLGSVTIQRPIADFGSFNGIQGPRKDLKDLGRFNGMRIP